MDILNINPQGKIALTLNEALLSPSHTLWWTPAIILLICKRADKKNYILSKGSEHFFSEPSANSLVMDTANRRSCQARFTLSPTDKESKHLDLLGRQSYSSAARQFHIANIRLAWQNTILSQFTHFIEHLPQSQRDWFQSIISEDQLVTKASLQSFQDSTGAPSRPTITAVVMRTAWLQSSGLPREVQNTVEDLPFEWPSSLVRIWTPFSTCLRIPRQCCVHWRFMQQKGI